MLEIKDLLSWLGYSQSYDLISLSKKAKIDYIKQSFLNYYSANNLTYPKTSLDDVILSEKFYIAEANLEPAESYERARIRKRRRDIFDDEEEDHEILSEDDYKSETIANRKQHLKSWCDSSAVLIPSKIRDFMASGEYDGNQKSWIERIPWYEESAQPLNASDLKTAEEILNKEIYGLNEVKQQVLEFIATQINTNSAIGTVLLLDGPPGIGKTSIANAIATALHRKSYSIKMPAYSSAWEICGLDKSWKGAKPGLIIDALITTNSFSPVIILDELDKLPESNRNEGNIPSVLLSILDSKRDEFMDSFLRIPVDLSKVIFIATSNNYHKINPILVDRFKVIELKGYKPAEKINIAEDYIIPSQKKLYGFSDNDIVIEKEALKSIVDNYAVEPGVRGLIHCIQSIFSYASKYKVDGRGKLRVTPTEVKNILKDPVIKSRMITATVGTGDAYMLDFHGVTGLFNIVQAMLYPGTGKIIKTGFTNPKLNECFDIVLSHLKKYSLIYDIEYEIFDKSDIHINILSNNVYYPNEYSLTIFISLLSAIKGFKTGPYAFLGEITLNGDILPVENFGDKYSSFILSEKVEKLFTKSVADDEKSIYSNTTNKTVVWVDKTFDVYTKLKELIKKED